MPDREAVESCATDIILWQSAAQNMPLMEVRAALEALQDDLAHVLDAFNTIYADNASGHRPVETDALTATISEVPQQAICTAIFALGLCQRTHLAAHQN